MGTFFGSDKPAVTAVTKADVEGGRKGQICFLSAAVSGHYQRHKVEEGTSCSLSSEHHVMQDLYGRVVCEQRVVWEKIYKHQI